MQTQSVAVSHGAPEAIHVGSWAAVLCGPGGTEERLGSCAEEKEIPAGLRRRLGTLGRMGVACGLGVAPQGDADIVFCSRHGDISLAHQLLTALVEGEPMSPAGFSMSVHNAVPGVLDLARKARIGHTQLRPVRRRSRPVSSKPGSALPARPHLDVVLVYAETPCPNSTTSSPTAILAGRRSRFVSRRTRARVSAFSRFGPWRNAIGCSASRCAAYGVSCAYNHRNVTRPCFPCRTPVAVAGFPLVAGECRRCNVLTTPGVCSEPVSLSAAFGIGGLVLSLTVFPLSISLCEIARSAPHTRSGLCMVRSGCTAIS